MKKEMPQNGRSRGRRAHRQNHLPFRWVRQQCTEYFLEKNMTFLNEFGDTAWMNANLIWIKYSGETTCQNLGIHIGCLSGSDVFDDRLCALMGKSILQSEMNFFSIKCCMHWWILVLQHANLLSTAKGAYTGFLVPTGTKLPLVFSLCKKWMQPRNYGILFCGQRNIISEWVFLP